ncbi:MAG: ADP-glyceromanno-heptose 6-epimerase [Candidatus Cloacimonetes bacterium]|nr:ADP-glyceromanno-heptose 6-epimerase [Candidatus Cloacimonadota bacterium]
MIVVTGGAGFIGSAFASLLNSQGVDDLLIVDNLGSNDKWKNLVNLHYYDYLHKVDFLELLIAGNFDDEIDAIVHMGACSSTTERDADYLVENNYRYSRHLAEWCIEHGVRFIYASSGATYGTGEMGFSDDFAMLSSLHPVNMYGYSKQMFDMWALRSGVFDSIAGVKFFNVFGPNEYHKGAMRSMVVKAFEQIRDTGKVKLFRSDHEDYADGEQKRDFIYVKDVARVVNWLLEHPAVNGLFNLGSGRAHTWLDLANATFLAMERRPQIEFVDMPEELKGRYQYFTEACMDRLRASGCDMAFVKLEEAVADYIRGYLLTTDPYLDPGDWQ